MKKARLKSRRHAPSEDLEPTCGKVPLCCDLIERSGTSLARDQNGTLVVFIRRLNEERLRLNSRRHARSAVWRRRAGSNRCIAVLQTAPLATWVRRPGGTHYKLGIGRVARAKTHETESTVA